jgi:predicted transcriptional regulator
MLNHLFVDLRSNTQNHDPIVKLVANIIPVLNGRDAAGNIIYLGPQTTKIHRYLIVVFLAKATQMFRLMGKEIDNSVYFTLYGLNKVAESFKQIGPYHLAINYDRTKVATRIYNMISNNGLVAIRKIGGETYITITEKGEDVSAKLLQELIAYEEFANIDKKADYVSKGTKGGIEIDPGLQRVERRLTEKISEINLQFESKTRKLDDRRHNGDIITT